MWSSQSIAQPPAPEVAGPDGIMTARVHPRRAQSRHVTIATTGSSACRRRSSGCGRRRIAARRSCRYSLRVTPRDALHQLAAGPAEQLPRAADVSRARRASSRVEVDLVAEMAVYNPFDFFLEPHAEQYPVRLRAVAAAGAAAVSAHRTADARASRRTCATIPREPSTHDRLPGRASTSGCSSDITLPDPHGARRPDAGGDARRSRAAPAATRRGCWCSCCATCGLAARFVSGYLIQLRPDVKPLDGPAGPATDFTDLHAWCEVYLPGAGWIGLDPTSGLLAGEGHIPLACTPEPASGRAGHRRRGRVRGRVSTTRCRVPRIYESPRVTKPYTDEQWGAIDALGRSRRRRPARRRRPPDDGRRADVRVDRRSRRRRVEHRRRSGPTKRLLRRRAARAAARALRAARASCTSARASGIRASRCRAGRFGCYWRRDGEPIWTTTRADRRRARARRPRPRRTRSASSATWRRASASAPSTSSPAYEDVCYYLWRERRLPVNVDPLDSRLDDELERARLRRVFSQGLDTVVGYALPLARARGSRRALALGPLVPARRAAVPDPRRLADGLPPAARLAAVVRRRRSSVVRAARSVRAARAAPASRGAAPRPAARTPSSAAAAPAAAPIAAGPHQQGRTSVRPRPLAANRRAARCAPRSAPSRATACCTSSCRRSTTLEDYLELVAAVEATAAALEHAGAARGLRAADGSAACGTFSGHARPRRHRGERPPGVATGTSWSTTRRRSTRRRASRGSTTEKFMLDGRHTGTGGGNHFVLGGATAGRQPAPAPARSAAQPAGVLAQPSVAVVPVLRPVHRPDQPGAARRRSAQRQPLRAGDRLRPAAAVRRRYAAVAGRPPVPQPADRRHRQHAPRRVLHRQAVLARHAAGPPRAARAARLRDAAARAHEPRAAAAAAGAVARFWQAPYTARLARWGTELHDRFMLPHFVEQDFDDVAATSCARSGYPLDAAWFAPHFEFRFPLVRRRSRRAACTSSCARRSSRGTSSARRARPAARCATSIRRSSGCRCT